MKKDRKSLVIWIDDLPILFINFDFMNFLAHLYLSPDNSRVMIGNFIADSIRGNRFKHYHTDIQKGIKLHREIDLFTDNHELHRTSKRRLHPRYGLYAGIIIDIFYDYYLAKNWNEYSSQSLENYVNSVYQLLQDNFDILPDKTQYMLPFMIEQNWLYNYQFKDGIERVLNGMNRRTKNKSQMNLAIEDLKLHEKDFEKDFKPFFKDLQEFTQQKTKELKI